MAKFHQTKTNLPDPTPQPRRRKRVWTFVLIGILFVLASISAYLIFATPQQNPPVTTDVTEQLQPVEIQAEGVTEQVLAWISTLSNSTGYAIEERCTSESVCVTSQAQKISIPYVLLALNTEETPTPPELDIALSTATGDIQYSPYSCSYAQKVFENGQLSSSEQLLEICTNQTLPEPQSTATLSTMVQEIQNLTRPLATNGSTIQDAAQMESFLISTAAVQDAVAMEQLAGSDTEALALNHYQDAVDVYTSAPDQVSPRIATLISASLTLYNQTNDTNFLDFAQFLFNKHYTTECTSLEQCTELIVASDMLGAATEELHYNDFRIRMINQTVEKFFDARERQGFRFNKQAFYKIEEGEIVYPLRENSILLSQINKDG